MKTHKKSRKRACSTNKKGLSYFIGCTHCIINTLVFIMICVGAVYLYKYIKHNSVFKVAQTESKPFVYKFANVPDVADAKPHGEWWFALYNADISNIDLVKNINQIKYVEFDDRTVFPSAEKLPKGFEPKKWLENGKNPGLGVRDLHAKGITGKGVTVAVIDNMLNIDHQEYKDNLIHFEVLGYPVEIPIEFHGPAVSSLLCGKTVGVAPDAKLVYFASSQFKGTENEKPGMAGLFISNDIAALKKVLEMNEKLPKSKRISGVSISRGWYNTDNNLAQEFTEVVNKLEETGVLVLTTNAEDYYGDIANFSTVDRIPNSDPDDPRSYVPGFWENGNMSGMLLAPAGGRTTAGPESKDEYMYSGAYSGMSWATPYIVGTWALAKQVYPNLKPKEFFEIARETGYRLDNHHGGYNIIIQPTKIIEYLQNKK